MSSINNLVDVFKDIVTTLKLFFRSSLGGPSEDLLTARLSERFRQFYSYVPVVTFLVATSVDPDILIVGVALSACKINDNLFVMLEGGLIELNHHVFSVWRAHLRSVSVVIVALRVSKVDIARLDVLVLVAEGSTV